MLHICLFKIQKWLIYIKHCSQIQFFPQRAVPESPPHLPPLLQKGRVRAMTVAASNTAAHRWSRSFQRPFRKTFSPTSTSSRGNRRKGPLMCGGCMTMEASVIYLHFKWHGGEIKFLIFKVYFVFLMGCLSCVAKVLNC